MYITVYLKHDGDVLNIGAFKHFVSEISLFHSFDEAALNVSFGEIVGTMITSRVVGSVNFKALDYHGDFRSIALK